MVNGSSAGRESVDGHGGAATPGSKNKAKKKSSNPYSTRGLDKYSTLRSELEARRTKIMEKAQGVSMVKFKYSDSDDLIPIVFRHQRDQLDQKHVDGKSTTNQPMSRSEAPRLDSKSVKAKVLPPPVAAGRKSAEKRMDWTARYYWHLVVVVELFGLVVFGRAFAVCCMLMWWYLVPVVHGDQGGTVKWSAKGGARRVNSNNTRINTGA